MRFGRTRIRVVAPHAGDRAPACGAEGPGGDGSETAGAPIAASVDGG